MTDCRIRLFEKTFDGDVVPEAGNAFPCPAPHHRAAVLA
jgi:hypothetical protein